MKDPIGRRNWWSRTKGKILPSVLGLLIGAGTILVWRPPPIRGFHDGRPIVTQPHKDTHERSESASAEVGWEQLKKLWEDIAEHASVEEEMKRWLEEKFNDLKMESYVDCTSEQKQYLQQLENNARKAMDEAWEQALHAKNKDHKILLLFEEAHINLMLWEAKLTDMCQ